MITPKIMYKENKIMISKLKSRSTLILMKCSNVTMMATPIVLAVTSANAAGAQDLMTEILKMVANLIIVLGLIFAVMGVISYASAHSEGDGPGQNKAIGKIAAGIMLIALSAMLKANAGQLVSQLNFT